MSEQTDCFCQATQRCKKTMRWISIEKKLRQAMQTVFEQVGLGGSERTYHCALFEHLCREKGALECSHMRCSLHSESVAPICLQPQQVPCGFMRSDIVLQWLPHVPNRKSAGRKRKRSEANETNNNNRSGDNTVDSRVQKCVLELKATTGALSSASIMQTLCYMRAFQAQYGLVCNFTQRCDTLQQALASLQSDASNSSKRKTIEFQLDKHSRVAQYVPCDGSLPQLLTTSAEIFCIVLCK